MTLYEALFCRSTHLGLFRVDRITRWRFEDLPDIRHVGRLVAFAHGLFEELQAFLHGGRLRSGQRRQHGLAVLRGVGVQLGLLEERGKSCLRQPCFLVFPLWKTGRHSLVQVL